MSFSPESRKEIILYGSASYLSFKGRDASRILNILKKFEPDTNRLEQIVEKADKQIWEQLFQKCRELLDDGNSYAEVLSNLEKEESNPEIAKFICDDWYSWQLKYEQMIEENPRNILKETMWIILWLLLLVILVILKESWVSYLAWSLGLITLVCQWYMGILERKVAKSTRFMIRKYKPLLAHNQSLYRMGWTGNFSRFAFQP